LICNGALKKPLENSYLALQYSEIRFLTKKRRFNKRKFL
jgi:hypothetical protein